MSQSALWVVVVASLLFFSVAIPQIRFESKPVEPLVDTPGKSVGSDFNGNGVHDLVVGAHLNDDFAGDAGSAYILYGTPNLSATYDLSGLGGLDVTIQGKAAGDYLGYEISSAGDINSDGFDDLLLGAEANDSAGPSGAGAAFIIYGSPNLSATFRVGPVGDVTVVGKLYQDRFAWATSGIGDFNGDGFDDVLMGAPYNDDTAATAGSAYILFGAASLSQTIPISGVGVDATLLGDAGSDQFGKKVAGAGDVNLDGFDDVMIGAYLNSDGGGANAGAAYVLYGGSTVTGTIPAGNHDVTILGKAASDFLGFDVAGLSDINNDGFDEVAAGAFGNDDVTPSGGAVYILYGRRSLSGTFATASSEENISLLGVGNAVRFGQIASGLGDVNDDGFFDFIVGAILSDYNARADSGAAYIIYGGTSLPSNIPSGNSDVTILGRNATDYLGQSTIGVGDINNDGIPDIAVGTRNGDDVTTNAGSAYIIFGSESLATSIDLAGTGADVTIAGNANGDQLGRFIGGGRMNRGP